MTDKEKFCMVVKCYDSFIKRQEEIRNALNGVDIYVDNSYDGFLCDLEKIIDDWFPDEEAVVERIFNLDYFGCTYIEKKDIEVCTIEELYDVLAEGQK